MKILIVGDAVDSFKGREGTEFRAAMRRFTSLDESDYQLATLFQTKLAKGKKVKGEVLAEAVANLYDLIASERPDVLVAMGGETMRAILGKRTLAYVHGIPHEVVVAGVSFICLPTYSTSAGLGSKGFHAVFAYDLQVIGRFCGQEQSGDRDGHSMGPGAKRSLPVDGPRAHGQEMESTGLQRCGTQGRGRNSLGLGNSSAGQAHLVSQSDSRPSPWSRGEPSESRWGLNPKLLPFSTEAGIVACDVEGWPEKPVSVQICCDGKRAHVIRADDTQAVRWLAEWLPEVRVVGHNFNYDITVLRAMGIDLTRYDDTMVMAYHHMLTTGSGVLEQESQNLGTQAYRYCGMELGELADCPGVDLEAQEIPYSDEVLEYAGQDAIATYRLAEFFLRWLDDNPEAKSVYRIDMGQVMLVRRMMDHGVPFEMDDVAAYFSECVGRRTDLLASLQAMVAKRGFHKFNPASPKQVQAIVKNYGLKVRKRTKGGDISTNEKALAGHKGHPFVDAIQSYREMNKLIGTYIEPLMRLDS